MEVINFLERISRVSRVCTLIYYGWRSGQVDFLHYVPRVQFPHETNI